MSQNENTYIIEPEDVLYIYPKNQLNDPDHPEATHYVQVNRSGNTNVFFKIKHSLGQTHIKLDKDVLMSALKDYLED